MTHRRRWGRRLILLGIATWVPYFTLRYLAQNDVPLGPFLTLHLMGVIPGALLTRGEGFSAWLKRFRRG